jgi:hypothetical protein
MLTLASTLFSLPQGFQQGLPDSLHLGRLQTQFPHCLSDPLHRLMFATGFASRDKLKQELPRRFLFEVQSIVFSHRPLHSRDLKQP